jgi:hypothetical protein
MNFGKIEWLKGDQAILDGIVQMAVFALTGARGARRSVMRVAMITLFQRKPPSSVRFFSTEYFTGMTSGCAKPEGLPFLLKHVYNPYREQVRLKSAQNH